MKKKRKYVRKTPEDQKPINIGVDEKDTRPKKREALPVLVPDANQIKAQKTRDRRLLRDGKGELADKILPLTSITRHLPDGKRTFIEYARLVGDTDERFKQMLEKWDSTSRGEQLLIPLEELARTYNITPGELLGKVTQVAYEHNTDISNYMAAVMQPDVVKKTIDMALTEEGFKDRELLHKHSGFTPTPQQGSNILIQSKLSQTNADKSGDGMSLPTMEEDVVPMGRIVRESVEGELVED